LHGPFKFAFENGNENQNPKEAKHSSLFVSKRNEKFEAKEAKIRSVGFAETSETGSVRFISLRSDKILKQNLGSLVVLYK
jgi:hypothetical protein